MNRWGTRAALEAAPAHMQKTSVELLPDVAIREHRPPGTALHGQLASSYDAVLLNMVMHYFSGPDVVAGLLDIYVFATPGDYAFVLFHLFVGTCSRNWTTFRLNARRPANGFQPGIPIAPGMPMCSRFGAIPAPSLIRRYAPSKRRRTLLCD